jgi:glucan 1,3-beta-glucosidase
VLRLCELHGLKAIIDIHAMKGSQNGLDNSGSEGTYEWTKTVSTGGAAVYNHWDMRGANWPGPFNSKTQQYEYYNMTNIHSSLKAVQRVVDLHFDDPVVVGMTPVNEPWDKIDMDVLKDYYWSSYQMVQAKAPQWITLLHDSFRLSVENWMSFMVDCPNYAIDTHIYQAWAWKGLPSYFIEHACMDGYNLRTLENAGIPIVVGEWSLATG